ncbi:hypothetical protein HanIR_Chr02g0071921 [Helianthus annuus]|nr:hypothetical protein HanIR_Chr02g0071921 [Helianthus annuus]
MIAVSSIRNTSILNWIASMANTLVILFVIVTGFLNADTSNMKPFAPYSVEGVFQAAAIVYFA